MFHKYEYPGMHQSLLWGISAAKYYMTIKLGGKYSINQIHSGYRCWEHEIPKKKGTTNHMGKAADIWFNKDMDRTSSTKDMDILRESIFCECIGAPKNKINSEFTFGWVNNKFGLEPASMGAKTYVHIDVREYPMNDSYFIKLNDNDNFNKKILMIKN